MKMITLVNKIVFFVSRHADACLELGTVAEGDQRLPLTGCTTQLLAASSGIADDHFDKKQSNTATAVTRPPTELPPVTTLYTSASDHIYVSWTSTIMNDEQNDIVFLIHYEGKVVPPRLIGFVLNICRPKMLNLNIEML